MGQSHRRKRAIGKRSRDHHRKPGLSYLLKACPHHYCIARSTHLKTETWEACIFPIHPSPNPKCLFLKVDESWGWGVVINANTSRMYLHQPTVFPFFLDAEKMLFTAMMTQPEISPFEDIITVRYDTLLAVRRLFAVAIKYSPVTPTHLSHISSFNRLSINIGSGTNRNNEHSQLKKTCTAKCC